MSLLFRVCGIDIFISFVAEIQLGISTSTSFYRNISGIGGWSQMSISSAILHSEVSISLLMPLVANYFSDPFVHMDRTNKTYGWVIAVKELRETVPNLFRYVSAWKRNKGIKSQGLWEMFLEKPDPEDDSPKFEDADGPGTSPHLIVDPEAMEGEKYNMCHFWSNFEIARFDFYKSKEYEEFFQMLEESGGFWQERVLFHMQSMLGDIRR